MTRKIESIGTEIKLLTEGDLPGYETYGNDAEQAINNFEETGEIPHLKSIKKLRELITEWYDIYQGQGVLGELETEIYPETQKRTRKLMNILIGENNIYASNDIRGLENKLKLNEATKRLKRKKGLLNKIKYHYTKGGLPFQTAFLYCTGTALLPMGIGAYMIYKAEKKKEEIKQIFNEVKNRILPSIGAKNADTIPKYERLEEFKPKTEDEIIDKMKYFSLGGTALGIIGSIASYFTLTELVDTLNNLPDPIETIKDTGLALTSIFSTYIGGDMLYTAYIKNKKIIKRFNYINNRIRFTSGNNIMPELKKGN